MKTQHTPGSWKIEGNRIVGANNLTVVDCYGAMSGDDTRADMRLLAAAPDLLESLINAASWLQVAVNDNAFEDCAMPRAAAHVLAQALALINKVRGNDNEAD